MQRSNVAWCRVAGSDIPCHLVLVVSLTYVHPGCATKATSPRTWGGFLYLHLTEADDVRSVRSPVLGLLSIETVKETDPVVDPSCGSIDLMTVHGMELSSCDAPATVDCSMVLRRAFRVSLARQTSLPLVSSYSYQR